MTQLMIKSWAAVRFQAILKKKSSPVTLQWANPLYPDFLCWCCFCIEWNSLVFKLSFLSFVLDKMTKILTIVFVCGTVAVVLSFLLSVREATVCSAQFNNGFKYFLKKNYYFHRIRTPRAEIAFTAWPKIHSHFQIFRYCRSILCLPHRPNFSDIFDLCPYWMSVVRVLTLPIISWWYLPKLGQYAVLANAGTYPALPLFWVLKLRRFSLRFSGLSFRLSRS